MPAMIRSHIVALAIGVLSSAAATDTPRVEWQAQPSGVTARLRGVSAVSARVAWASGANGTVLRTIDGGADLAAAARARRRDARLPRRRRDERARRVRAQHRTRREPPASTRPPTAARGGTCSSRTPIPRSSSTRWRSVTRTTASRSATPWTASFVILTTVDGGRAWNRVPADRLPAALPGEGAFAASGTNVARPRPRRGLDWHHGRTRPAIGRRRPELGDRDHADPDERVGRHLLDRLSRRPARRRRRRRLQQGNRGRRQRRLHERRRRDLDARQGARPVRLPIGGRVGARERRASLIAVGPVRRRLVVRRRPELDAAGRRRLRHGELCGSGRAPAGPRARVDGSQG